MSNSFGWIKNEKAVEKVMDSLPFPIFGDIWSPIKDTGKGKIVLTYDYIIKVAGSFPMRKQAIGDCVSQGSAYAVDGVKSIDIFLKKEFEEWVAETATEDIYAGSRIQIGKGQCGTGDGSVGAWAAEYVNKFGALPRQKYGSIDLSSYDGNKAKDWGMPNKGVPSELITIAKQHPIQTVSLVTSYEQCRDLIANGYTVTVASMQGFSSTRDSEGFAKPEGSWAHQMCCKSGTIIKSLDNKSIENIVVGDLVYDMYGNLKKVTNTYKRHYNDFIIKIKTSGREHVYLTPNHPILVYRKIINEVEAFNTVDIPLYANRAYKLSNKNSNHDINKRYLKWINCEDLQIGDWVFCPKPIINNNEQIKWIIKNNKSRNIPKNIDIKNEDFSWFLGLFAADGNSSKSHKISITLHKNDLKSIEKCKRVINEVIGLNCTTKDVGNATIIYCYSSILADSFNEWFKSGKNKRIPHFVFNSDLQSFIDGFIDGDGTRLENSNKITNCNPQIIESLHTFLLVLGYNPTISKFSYKDKKYGNKNWSDRYEIYVSASDTKKHNWWSSNNYIYRISSIEKEIIDEDVYNLEVEDTHTYIANGIVVHNCILGVDDNQKRPGVLIQNSWGIWNGGPKRHNQPDGSFWVDADVLENKMLKDKDSWGYSGYQGFKPQKLNTRIF